jgi:hypothetical protein
VEKKHASKRLAGSSERFERPKLLVLFYAQQKKQVTFTFIPFGFQRKPLQTNERRAAREIDKIPIVILQRGKRNAKVRRPRYNRMAFDWLWKNTHAVLCHSRILEHQQTNHRMHLC